MDKQESKSLKGDIKDYILQTEIGHGASGICYKALSRISGQVCAIKKISINTIKGNSLKLALKEVEVLKAIDHPNIIKYYDSFADENYLYIVMEYAQKGDLHAMLKRRKIKQQFYPQTQIWEMGKQLLQALKYLHSKNIVHRDFKTLNIFINDKNNLLVGDLGVSKIIKNDMGLYSRVGTPLYLAPEIIKYEKYDYKADIWGFGCVMYILSSLVHPFEGKNIINLGQNIIHAQPKPISNYSNELNSLIKSALQKNPMKRPDAKLLLHLYYSPNTQKLRIPAQNAKKTDKKFQDMNNIKTQPTIQYKQRQQKVNCFFIDNSPQKQIKNTKNCKSQMQLYQVKNQNKIGKGNDCRYKEDQTVILPQSSILKIIDVPQEKTRIRTLFSAKQKNPYYKPQLEKQAPIFKAERRQSLKVATSLTKESMKLPISKPQEIKLPTQGFDQEKQKCKEQGFLKLRNIQSAKLKPAVPVFEKELNTSYQGLNKFKEVLSVNRGFFESEQEKIPHKTQLRPKSSIGRRDLALANVLKYVRRKKIPVENQDISQTKTQLLRKPQVIII